MVHRLIRLKELTDTLKGTYGLLRCKPETLLYFPLCSLTGPCQCTAHLFIHRMFDCRLTADV
jgi:hypothetical protein